MQCINYLSVWSRWLFSYANDIEQKLIRIGKKVIYNNDLHIQMTFTQSMTKDDTALIISYSGTTAGLVDISKILVEKKYSVYFNYTN